MEIGKHFGYKGTDLCQIMWNNLKILVCEHNQTSFICFKHIFHPALLSFKLTKEF